ncbi:hypothetical protein CLV51_102205 [Chitinophaga niastensis]|uniref:Lipoprotein n=1 Tax=Chitinophaga niastensis TaxID=536980 RepID=A0A2P8HMB8_CHINA|nr:hypothetical protein [Chitinophaga niastensis]PSL47359.1 hypothetical protein CLV51_102205 [Chitinophaga niastensis]
MKNTVLMIGVACLMSCCTSIKLAIPEKFKQQATMQHVSGARGNKMSFGNFTTSKIRRGIHLSYPPWGWGGRGFLLENILLNQIGIQKNETVTKEKTKFRYTLSDGKNNVEVYADEKEMTKKLEYEIINSNSIFSNFEQLQQYKYIFSAIISADTTQGSKNWELLMTNIYDRKAENDKNPFTFIKQEDNGLATNGNDTIFIKPLSIKKTALSNGKTGQLPFKLLSGYELSTNDGVIAIIDMIDRNIWFYNELGAAEKLNIGAIATAIFARKVHDVKW